MLWFLYLHQSGLQLQIIFSVYRRFDKAIDPQEIHAEISSRLREELDYTREAAHIKLYQIMLSAEENVHIPEIFPELSTDRLLSMSWLDGENLLTAREDPQIKRNKIAQNLFRAWYVPFYSYGCIHGDPHLGNYSVRADGTFYHILRYIAFRNYSFTKVNNL